MQCPKCEVETPDGFKFCESCGTRLGASAEPTADPSTEHSVESGGCPCGAGPSEIDAQGYCIGCGKKRVFDTRKHLEIVLSGDLAGVTDIGKRHPTNQDDLAMATVALGAENASIMVVCDGVSSAQNAEAASAVAVKTVCELLQTAALQEGSDLGIAMTEAIGAAHQAVCALPYLEGAPKDPPAATIVAAVVRGGVATIGWLGDSRAYWFTPEQGMQLTRDHSWVNEAVDTGEMTEAQALISPLAHAITRCLGVMEGEDPAMAPEVGLLNFTLNSPGCLLLCTDGLWNYAPETEQIGTLLYAGTAPEEALVAARRLVAFANQEGGRDNITAALYRV